MAEFDILLVLFPPLFHLLPYSLLQWWLRKIIQYLEGAAHFLSFWHSLLYTGPTSDTSPPTLSHWPSHTVTFIKIKIKKSEKLYFHVQHFSLHGRKNVLHLCDVKSLPCLSNVTLERKIGWYCVLLKLTFGSSRNSRQTKAITSRLLSITAVLFFVLGKTERRKNRTVSTAERVLSPVKPNSRFKDILRRACSSLNQFALTIKLQKHWLFQEFKNGLSEEMNCRPFSTISQIGFVPQEILYRDIFLFSWVTETTLLASMKVL